MRKRIYGIYDSIQDAYEAVLRLVGLGYRRDEIFLLGDQEHCPCRKPLPETQAAIAREKRAATQRELLRNASTVCGVEESCGAFFLSDSDQEILKQVQSHLEEGHIVIFVQHGGASSTGQNP